MITVGVLICLTTLTSQLVHSKVITIDITSGNSSPQCCTEEGCICASLSIALQYINSSTTINITSSSVMLEDSIKLGSNHTSGSGNLTDITITGSNVTIMCNYSGSVYCESCDDVMIEGITWDRCGDLKGINIAGVTFNGSSNISLVNCTFQLCQIPAVTFLNVSGNVNVTHCNFLLNMRIYSTGMVGNRFGGFLIHYSSSNFVSVIISDSYFYYNGFSHDPYIQFGLVLDILDTNNLTMWNITITKTIFFLNGGPVIFDISGSSSIQLTEITFNNSIPDVSTLFNPPALYFGLSGDSCSVSVVNSLFRDNIGSSFLCQAEASNEVKILIMNSTFTYNQGSIDIISSASMVLITLVDVEISHSIIQDTADWLGRGGILSINVAGNVFTDHNGTVNLTRVNMLSNIVKYSGSIGGAIYIAYNYADISALTKHVIIFEECIVFNNTASRRAAIYIDNNGDINTLYIISSIIYSNIADGSIIYFSYMDVIVKSSNFTDNVGSCMYLFESNLLCDDAIFANNVADNGAALYLDQGSSITVNDNIRVQFTNNSAVEYGGAIYINIVYDCPYINPPFHAGPYLLQNSVISFVNNTATVSGNSLYFYVPKHCIVDTDIRDQSSLLYAPCQFNYSQPVNDKMMNVPCDLDYTLLNDTGAPIVTSPHELKLYFPYNDGYNISIGNHNVYFIRNNLLGYPVKFTGNVFDYFGKPAEPTQFNVQCVNCSSSIVLPKVNFLVNNITSLSITFTGSNIENTVNVNLTLASTVHSFTEIYTTLLVELMPCIDHPGYTYSMAHKACVCYHHNVDCHDSYNEIKKGYWFGSVSNTATTAPCHHYCKFTGRTETRQGYVELPNTIDGQCNDHRVGRACGECSSGYTLSYDSTDCISVDQCGTGWTVLVITLTCLYWIAIVAGVFGLMYTLYFKFQMSLGYLYGLIYYYSIISMLLDNNPNLSDGVFQFASVLSSFAQLTPQFLGKLCFVKGLSGIDQLFIHYSHAVGVSLLLLLIVVAARWSARVTSFVSRCIIPVICLLILLSYTSIVSTSLQLLQPLRFTDVKEWYTYSSPNIQYFHGRHAVYGVVAIICELVVGIGLPLLLLLQPFLSRKINFIRIKPLLDQFQGCYKDKYHCFAAYYLICRQVILAIVLSSNHSYYDTAFYLLAASIIIAGIHIWIQPYRRPLLNGVDGIVLLLMILANGYVYMNNWLTTVLEIITLMLPLIFFLMVFISKGILSCRKKERHYRYRYVNINNDDVDDEVAAEENIIRFVSLTITS